MDMVALIVNQIGAMFTGTASVIGVAVAVVLIAGIIYMLFKPYKESNTLKY